MSYVLGGQSSPAGLTGATGATRYAGATTLGAPSSGTFAVGDYVIDQTGYVYICITAGTPGTWTQSASVFATGTAGSEATSLDVWTPAYHGFKAWTMDPAIAALNGAGVALVTTSVYSARLFCPTAFTAANLWISIRTAGSSLTSNQCLIGLYNNAGTQIGTCPDQSAIWTTAGTYSSALTVVGGQSLAVVAGTYVYVLVMANGTTPPLVNGSITVGGTGVANANLTSPSAAIRFSRQATAQTALPVSFTPANLSGSLQVGFWTAIS